MEVYQIIKTIWVKTWKIQLRYKLDTFSMIFRPLLNILPYVLVGNYLFNNRQYFYGYTGTENYKLYIVLSMIFVNFIVNTISFTMVSLVDELQQGTIENILVLPLNIELFWYIELICSTILQIGSSIILLITSCYLLDIVFNIYHITLLLFAITLAVILNIGIGIFLSGVTFKTKTTKMAFLLLSLITFSAGEIYPISVFPLAIRVIAYFNPLTYLLDIVRYSVLDTATYIDIKIEIIIIILLAIAVFIIGTYKYRCIINKLKTKGTLTNY